MNTKNAKKYLCIFLAGLPFCRTCSFYTQGAQSGKGIKQDLFPHFSGKKWSSFLDLCAPKSQRPEIQKTSKFIRKGGKPSNSEDF